MASFCRIPREYWAHRLRMAHAMGLNTVCAYLFWNMHEPKPGEFIASIAGRRGKDAAWPEVPTKVADGPAGR